MTPEKRRFTIHYASREFAREMGDLELGVVEATSKEEAEVLAMKDGEIMSRAVPCTTLWAVVVKQSEGRTP